MFKTVGKILDHLFVVAGALFFIQIPLFMQQYRLQLVGRVAELRLLVEEMQSRAGDSGRTLQELILKFSSSSDSDFSLQGSVMQAIVERWKSLSEALNALEHASVFSRPFQFIAHFHYDVARSTWESFELGIPLTFEGLVYALVGMWIGYLCFVALNRLLGNRID